ncbi:probable lysophospholipase BODYGUARD 3 [Impatiens glandulifera]|uniref:probable lysophospholipase BODYGUARD 3 n=1 Tax=Impatiens glandulifera TaxID=253017 RepID=UPI001FB18F8E|nr:probable lysophospholipase BODYGUARD 3 [Impatiens glandulifera]
MAGAMMRRMTQRTLNSSGLTLMRAGEAINVVLSFIVFFFIDILDFILCYVYKLADFIIESEWKSCYCSTTTTTTTTSSSITSAADNILVSELRGQPTRKVVRVSSSKIQLDDISDTLYTRSSVVYDVSRTTRRRRQGGEEGCCSHKLVKKTTGGRSGNATTAAATAAFTVNSTIVEILKEKIKSGDRPQTVPRWTDCDCHTCNSWSVSSTNKDTLFVKTEPKILGPPKDDFVHEDVLFIHGFISSSAFWTKTLFPNFSKSAKSTYRMFAVDLLGFGRSPKPNDSLYTLREHLDMIEKSVIEPYNVKSFHIVAHSLGCILAIALAIKHPGSVKSLTLLAPPYFPVPKGELQATQYIMRKVAPRRVWPLLVFGTSMACWYEHVSRTICFLICKNHRWWDFIAKMITRNRMRTYLIEGFCCHTHNAAWHTLHNIICGTAAKMDRYLEVVRNQLKCHVTIYHGRNDELIPFECSYNLQLRIPRARVKIIENKDHITIVVGRQDTFAKELEQIWKNSKGC